MTATTFSIEFKRTSLNELVVSFATAANVHGTPKLRAPLTAGGVYKDYLEAGIMVLERF